MKNMTSFRERLTAPSVTKDTAKEMSTSSAQTKTLKELKVGETAHIVDFIKETDTVRKIEAMGLRRGRKITVLQKLGRGILVKTSNSRIVITSDVAKNIEVK